MDFKVTEETTRGKLYRAIYYKPRNAHKHIKMLVNTQKGEFLIGKIYHAVDLPDGAKDTDDERYFTESMTRIYELMGNQY